MSYAIFRVQPINTLKDLRAIGSHNLRTKEAYQSNPDIVLEKTKDNIEVVNCTSTYHKKFMQIVSPYKTEYEQKQKTIREDRKKSFYKMLDDSNSVIADELLFTSDYEFFKNMNKDEIMTWAKSCMEFVYEDIGYDKSQILNATIHLDEKTPHLHCVVVPLVKKYDKRSKTEKYTLSKKHYMKDRIYLSNLQTKYHQRLVNNGYDLDRGILGSDAEHIPINEYKKMTRKLNAELSNATTKINTALEDFEDKMKTNKTTLLDKEYVKVKKDTFDSMNKVIKETKKVAEIQPKLDTMFKNINNFTESYTSMKKERDNVKKELKYLRNRNYKLENENSHLLDYIKAIFKAFKKFFRELLEFGSEKIKESTVNEIKDIFDNKEYDENDIYDIAVDTPKEDELFKYADIEKDFEPISKDDDFEI